MKIAIHHRAGSFSERWIEYCKENSISYKIVNAYESDIIKQVEDCNIFLWHHDHNNYKDLIVAKKVLFALEHLGKIVFPNFKTGWHFDDKIAQKYLLESLEAPLVPSYVFYDKDEAISWARTTKFPKVFKLKGGSGSSNVRLVKSEKQCIALIKKSFGKGIVAHDFKSYAKEKWRHFIQNGYKITDLLKIGYRFLFSSELSKHIPRERDYVYFQDFFPFNSYDIRVIVIGKIAFGIKRRVRDNDFRASGSGLIDYAKEVIDIRCVEMAFSINKRLQSDCTSFDFIFDENNNPFIVEVSYGYAPEVYPPCPGYWTENLVWHEGSFNSEGFIIQNIIEKSKN